MYNKLLVPNHKLSPKQNSLLIGLQVGLLFLIWNIFNSTLFPRPQEIGTALVDLIVNKGVFREFLKSIGLCTEAMLISVVICLVLAYLSVLPLFRPLATFATKLRFLPTVGLTFLFLKISDGQVDGEKMLLLVFGIGVFFVTSIMGVITSTTIDELNYARTLRFNEFRVTWEVIILGKMDQVFVSISQNFAMAWMMIAMVENICKSSGGIGVAISDANKYFKFDYVWAIQLLILMTGVCMDISLRKMRVFLMPYSDLITQRK